MKTSRILFSDHVFEMTGGRLCLDFANTVDNRPAEKRKDFLNSYSGLLSWSLQAKLLTDRQASLLAAAAARQPARAQDALKTAIQLREAMYEIFSAAAQRARPPRPALEEFNGAAAPHLACSRVVYGEKGFALESSVPPEELDRMLWAVVRSALDLLTAEDLLRVRVCAAEDCGWLFVDESRNRTRRWCNMKVCGNRSKVRRYRRKLKPAQAR